MRKKTNWVKRMYLATFAAVLLSSAVLSGCSLAAPPLGADDGGDVLCGVLVTLSDDEEQLAELQQEEANIDLDTLKKVGDGEYVAEMEARSDTPIIEGIPLGDDKYDFPGITGYYLICFSETVEEDGETYKDNSLLASPEIYEIELAEHVNSDENTQITTVSGTLTLTQAMADSPVRLNSIYQRPDGSLYAVIPGTASMSIANLPGFGKRGSMSTSTTIKSTAAINSLAGAFGKSTSEKEEIGVGSAFEIAFEVIPYLEYAEIKEMSADNRLIKTWPVAYDKDEYSVSGDAAYVIVEEHILDEKGNPAVRRFIYDRSEMEDSDMGGATHRFVRSLSDRQMEAFSLRLIGD